MEDTLRAFDKIVALFSNGLNPCFNGRYSQSAKAVKNLKVSLNPCFNGRYSQSDNIKRYRTNTRS